MSTIASKGMRENNFSGACATFQVDLHSFETGFRFMNNKKIVSIQFQSSFP